MIQKDSSQLEKSVANELGEDNRPHAVGMSACVGKERLGLRNPVVCCGAWDVVLWKHVSF